MTTHLDAKITSAKCSSGTNAYFESLKYIHQSPNGLIAKWKNLTIHSEFQPIVSLSHGRVVGYEALMRPSNIHGTSLSPENVLKSFENRADSIFLDRLCRTLHVNSFKRFSKVDNWLFLNISPDTIIYGVQYGNFFNQLIKNSGFPPQNIVVEILETPNSDEKRLCQSIEFYKNLGCLVAIDDFGAGYSNFNRIWRLKPNIVKLDRTIIKNSVTNAVAGRILPGIISILHEVGCLVIVEGIENETEANIAFECGSDLAQGWYFDKPKKEINLTYQIKQKIIKLHDNYRDLSKLSKLDAKYMLEATMLKDATENLIPDNSFTYENQFEIQKLMSLSRAERCYLIDEFGFQVTQSIVNPKFQNDTPNQFSPIEDCKGAYWGHRLYTQRAIENLGTVQITRPYLSVATAKTCVTLSLAFFFRGRVHIICLDLQDQ